MHPSDRPEPRDPLAELAAEVGAIGQRLDRIGSELLALREATAGSGEAAGRPAGAPAAPATVPVPPPVPAPAGPAAAPPWPGPPYPAPQQWAPPGQWPGQAPWPPAGPQPGPRPGPQPAGLGGQPGWTPPAAPPARPLPPRRPSFTIATLLPWTGGALTLIGVVSLVVLAVQRGWFSPEARIVLGGVLGAALVGTGMWLHRREASRTGALALAATGFATLYLVIAGATFVVGLPEIPAVLLALVVAAGGLGLADRWRSQLLGGGVVVGAAVLAPVLVSGLLLVSLVLVLQVAALPVVLRRSWPVLALIAAAGPVLYGIVLAVEETADAPRAAVTGVVAVLVVGLATAVLGARRLTAAPVSALLAAAPVPLLGAAPELGRWGGVALAAGAGVVLLATAAVPWMARTARVVATTAAAVVLFQATALAFDGATRTAVFLGQATVLAVVAAVLHRRLPLFVSAAYGIVGVGAALVLDAPLAALVEPRPPYLVDGMPVTSALVGGLVVSVLVVALAVAALVAAGRLGLVRPDAATAWFWVPTGLVGLYGAAGTVITAALLVTGDRIGFTAGHAVVTVSWTVGALALLAWGISRQALRVTGLALVAAAVAKLVMYDLAALDGLAQVVAFLGAGLIILAAGTRYARLVAEAEAREAGEPDGVPVATGDPDGPGAAR